MLSLQLWPLFMLATTHAGYYFGFVVAVCAALAELVEPEGQDLEIVRLLEESIFYFPDVGALERVEAAHDRWLYPPLLRSLLA